MNQRLKKQGEGPSSRRIRDSLVTDAFFGQHFCTQGCPCGHQEALSRLEAIRRAFKEKVKAYLEEPRPKPSKAFCESELIGMQDERDRPEYRIAFDLVDLVAEYEIYDNRDEDSRFSLDKCIGWLHMIETEAKDLSAKDPSFQLGKHLNSAIERLNLRYYSLNVMLGQVQSFNVEKILEPPNMANTDIYSQRGERLNPEQTRLDLRSSFNDPAILIRKTSEGRNLRQKSKAFDPDESLARMNRNLSALVDEAKKINEILPSKDLVIPPRDLSSYKSIPIPDSFPHKIKESLTDIEFLQSECTITRKALVGLLTHVLMTLGIWFDNGKVSWEWGTSHVHDLANFRRYEYHRTDLRSMVVTLRLAEENVINYLNGRYLNKRDGPLGTKAKQARKDKGLSRTPLKPSKGALGSAVLEGQEVSLAFAPDSGTASWSRFADDIEKLNGQKSKADEEALVNFFGSGGAQSLCAPLENLQLQDENETLPRKLSDMTDATALTHQPPGLTSSLKSSGPRQSRTSATTSNSSTRLPFHNPVAQAKTPVPMQLDIQRRKLNNAVASPKWRKGLLSALQVIELQYPDAEPQIQHALTLCAEFRIGRVSKETREREWDEQLGNLHKEFPAVAYLIEQVEEQIKEQGGWDCEDGGSTNKACNIRGDASGKKEVTEEENVGEKEAKPVDEEPKEDELHEEQGLSKKKRNNKNKNKNRKIKRQAEKKAAKGSTFAT
ncbi:MAG: hypothetical protein LQ342_005336 [Letrouitia transgressa]|nr:MAG: hypothetical protein LQ342_005336 [Letrouitia transgressa]